VRIRVCTAAIPAYLVDLVQNWEVAFITVLFWYLVMSCAVLLAFHIEVGAMLVFLLGSSGASGTGMRFPIGSATRASAVSSRREQTDRSNQPSLALPEERCIGKTDHLTSH